jgi:DNA invertase Pin-like site-specific DNA recombinase
MYFYYSRISTTGQNSGRQLANFKHHGHVSSNNVFIDKISGSVPFFQRPEAVKLFDNITSIKGNDKTIVIDSVDRFGRNLVDILNSIQVFTENGINIISLKEGFQTLIDGKENPMAKLVIACMGSIAEMERNRIRERQAEGILIARSIGKFKGRKVGSVQSKEKLLSRYPTIVQKLKKGLSVRDTAEITSSSTATVMKVRKALQLSI